MAENERKEVQGKRNIFRVTKFTRRQVLKSIGIVAAGTAMASIPLASACKSSSSTTAGKTTGINTTGVTTSSPPVSSSTNSTVPTSASTMPATSSSTATTSNSTTPVTSTPATTAFSYIPPTALPQMLGVPGTSCTVATDRSYSADHIWVKSLSVNLVVMGITASMVEILGEPYSLTLLPIRTQLSLDDVFGTIEGYKITADLLTPVNGVILQMNDILTTPTKGGMIFPINGDPYNSGWFIVVQLNNPNDLKSLLTPQGYVNLLVAGH